MPRVRTRAGLTSLGDAPRPRRVSRQAGRGCGRPPASLRRCCGRRERSSLRLCAFWFQERLLALKRSMSFMQDMDFSQQAALLGNEDTAAEEPAPEVVPVHIETAKKSKRPSREVIR